MKYSIFTKSLGAAAAALSLLTSSIASAAPVSAKAVDPMVVLSALGSSSSHAALCAGGGDAQAGCGLAAVDTATLAAVSSAQYTDDRVDSQPNLVPLFLVLAGMAAVFFLLDDTILGDDDDDDIEFDVSPV
jgi:hypothetical protein